MPKYVAKRVAYMVVVFFVISFIMYFIYNLIPGDPAAISLESVRDMPYLFVKSSVALNLS